MVCGDSSPLFGEGFSVHHLPVSSAGTRVTGRAGTRLSNPCNGRTRSTVRFSDIGRTMALDRARQACPSERFLGGTCSSGPLFNTRPRITFRRLVGAIHELPLRYMEEPACQVRRSTLDHQFLVRRSMIHCLSSGTTSVPLRTIFRRDLLVRSAYQRSVLHLLSAGPTGVPLRACRAPEDWWSG